MIEQGLDYEVILVLQYVLRVMLSWRREFHILEFLLGRLTKLFNHLLPLIYGVLTRTILVCGRIHVLVVLRVHERVGYGQLLPGFVLNLFQKSAVGFLAVLLELLVHFQTVDLVREFFCALDFRQLTRALGFGLVAARIVGAVRQVLVFILLDKHLGPFGVHLELI